MRNQRDPHSHFPLTPGGCQLYDRLADIPPPPLGRGAGRFQYPDRYGDRHF
jgi:hypothetical protein